jgi:hypothetical protein
MTNAKTETPKVTIKPGQSVLYVSSKGYVKPAIVVNTPETVVEGHAIPSLAEGELHLLVFSLTNGISPRLNVRDQDAALKFALENGEADADKAQGYWKLPE